MRHGKDIGESFLKMGEGKPFYKIAFSPFFKVFEGVWGNFFTKAPLALKYKILHIKTNLRSVLWWKASL